MPNDQPDLKQHTQRGREAERPQDIPAPGWKDVLQRSWHSINDNNIWLASGGVSYAVVVALFPGLAALVSVYGLVMNPQQIEAQVNALSGVLPGETQQLIATELHQLVASSTGALGIGAIFGFLLALWSASRGMSGMMNALNMAYEQTESRSFLRYNLIALVMTIGLIVSGILAIALIAGLPAAAQAMGLGSTLQWLSWLVQWPLLVILMGAVLAVLYRYGPSREEPQWQWVSPGAIVATVLWIIASICFTAYVTNFSTYNKTYGSLGGAIVLLTWLYISAFVVLLGAVVNAQSELQTRKDTTTGTPRPMGQRGALAADRVAPSTDNGQS